jgi:hypothetical protein
VESIGEVDGNTDAVALVMIFCTPPDAMGMRFQKDCAEPLDRIKKALRDMTFPFITSKYYSMTKTSAKPVISNTSISMYFFHTISLLE